MKNKLMAAFAVSALALGVSAAQADDHFYAGASAGYFDSHADLEKSVNEGVAGLQLGYHFNPDWSVELGQLSGIATGHDHQQVISLTAAYRLWGDQTQILALGGIQNVRYTNSEVEPVLGLAVSHYFTDNVEARLSVLGGIADAEYMTSTLSLNYHFGTHQDAVAEPEPEKVAPAVVMTKTLHAHFDTDKSKVRPADRAEIVPVAQAMKSNPGSTATIVGHTDSTASDAYNQKLSERRADAVKKVMVEEGVNPDAIETSGRGEMEPVESNDTTAGRQANRRIEAVVTGLPQ
ncbi:MAG: OmpA family protein [Pseudomonadales bacterium]|jgi:outer membrane protein OmpA-like peptidoglycan-associated protein